MQLSSQECDRTRAPFNTVQRFILTPSSTTTPAPMETLGPMVQFSPICAVGSYGGAAGDGGGLGSARLPAGRQADGRRGDRDSPPERCRGSRDPCAGARERAAAATGGTCTSPSGSPWAGRCPSRSLQRDGETGSEQNRCMSESDGGIDVLVFYTSQRFDYGTQMCLLGCAVIHS